MKLLLHRRWYFVPFTGGDLYIDGRYFCRTIEDRVRDPGDKVRGETAIPTGTYKIALTMSPRFGKVLPELLQVPMFSGVRIHSGNTAADSEGCILVGTATEKDIARTGRIAESRVTMDRLMALMISTQKRGEGIQITIE